MYLTHNCYVKATGQEVPDDSETLILKHTITSSAM